MIRFTLGSYDIEIGTRARRGWNEFIHRTTEYSTYYVWGRLTFSIENWKLEVHPVCAQCDSRDVGEVSSGDEGWTVCQSCCSVEGGYRYVNLRQFEQG